jgi:hypothetical protein
MSQTVIQELDALVDHSRRMLVAPSVDFAEWQVWSTRRAELFERLKETDFLAAGTERSAIAARAEELLKIDATIIAKLESVLVELQRQLAEAQKARRSLNSLPRHGAVLECCA